MTSRRHVVVATSDPVTERMAGPAIRAWHMAEGLAAEHDVHLVTTERCDRSSDAFEVRGVSPEDLRSLERDWDVLVMQGGLLRTHPFIAESSKPIVVDLYDPFHLENLEQTRGRPMEEREAVVAHLTGVLNDQLRRGDFFMCASGRQRNFWLGSLAAMGRLSPQVLAVDPTLDSLVAIVPFGLSPDPPHRSGQVLRGVVDGIGADDAVLLWAGGVYNWFDPVTLVRAVDVLRPAIPELRLHFLGLRNPNPAIPETPLVAELRRTAGPGVTFNEGWVDYDRRADYLIEADVGVSAHLDHIETAFSFRTRILDYLWAGLPIVTTAGDSFADLVERHSLGATAPAGDIDAMASAIRAALEHPRTGIDEVARRFTWPNAVRPLLEFCRSPRRAPDAASPRSSWLSRVLRPRGRT